MKSLIKTILEVKRVGNYLDAYLINQDEMAKTYKVDILGIEQDFHLFKEDTSEISIEYNGEPEGGQDDDLWQQYDQLLQNLGKLDIPYEDELEYDGGYEVRRVTIPIQYIRFHDQINEVKRIGNRIQLKPGGNFYINGQWVMPVYSKRNPGMCFLDWTSRLEKDEITSYLDLLGIPYSGVEGTELILVNPIYFENTEDIQEVKRIPNGILDIEDDDIETFIHWCAANPDLVAKYSGDGADKEQNDNIIFNYWMKGNALGMAKAYLRKWKSKAQAGELDEVKRIKQLQTKRNIRDVLNFDTPFLKNIILNRSDSYPGHHFIESNTRGGDIKEYLDEIGIEYFQDSTLIYIKDIYINFP
jgi:hypothetical protein